LSLQSTITIGTPIRNREWILDDFFKGILNLNYDKKSINLVFLINDSQDRSMEKVYIFTDKNHNKYKNITVLSKRYYAPEDKRTNRSRDKIIPHLARVRNDLLQSVRDLNSDYFLSLDSDIIVNPEIINNLISHDKDIISSIIYNDENHDKTYPNRYNNIMISCNDSYAHYLDYPQHEIFPVDVTGACYLLKNGVYRIINYDDHPQGEDIAFCKKAKQHGFEIWCDPTTRSNHIMSKESLKLGVC